jgi:hypothetical protein
MACTKRREIHTVMLCESPSNLTAWFDFRLQEPKISSPSTCANLIVQVKPGEYFEIASISCFKSPDWVVLRKSSSPLLGP